MLEFFVGAILLGFLGLFVAISMPLKDAERLMNNEQPNSTISDQSPSL